MVFQQSRACPPPASAAVQAGMLLAACFAGVLGNRGPRTRPARHCRPGRTSREGQAAAHTCRGLTSFVTLSNRRGNIHKCGPSQPQPALATIWRKSDNSPSQGTMSDAAAPVWLAPDDLYLTKTQWTTWYAALVVHNFLSPNSLCSLNQEETA